jgi:hypothetical protein
MARQCRDVEVVRTFWKMFARDADCPWPLRVYCVNNLAVSAKMATEFPPIPGTYRPPIKNLDPNPEISKNAPTEVDVEAAKAVKDVKQFLKQLGGENGDPQT